MKYLVKFYSSKKTTTGEPNKKTGKYSIACKCEIYRGQKLEVNSSGIDDEIVTKTGLRKYCMGMSIQEFEYCLECLECLE